MSRFKPGDFAVVIGGYYPQAIGCTVELIAFLQPGEEMTVFGVSGCNGEDKPLWLVRGDFEIMWNPAPGFMLSPDRHLLPLRGDDFSNELIESINQGERVAV